MLINEDDPGSMRRISYAYSLLILGSIVLLAGESVALPNLRGVSPQDEGYFKTAIIKCRDGSKSFSQERLNDDYCDCVDGTDEPGTNACPESRFYCKNLGHRPVVLFSSRVNDGICDCCDGSDEYDGKVTCADTCWEAGKVSREKLKKKLGVFKEGSNIRKQDVETSKRLRRQHEEELITLKRDEKSISSVVDKLRADKEAVEKEEKRAREEKERIEKEERERREREITPTKEESQQAEESSNPVQEDAEDTEHMEGSEEKEVDSIPDTPTSEADELAGLSEEDRGRVIASRWTGEDVSDIKANREKDHTDEENDLSDEEDSDNNDEHDIPHDEDDDYETQPFSPAESPKITGAQSHDGDATWWSKLMVGTNAIMKLFRLANHPPVDVSEAEKIRKEFRGASDKLQGIQSKLTDLENRLKQDFGKDGEFYSFYDKCFELKDKKYTYKVCPYKDASQVEGHSTTRLGRWQGFKDEYTSMVFEQGDRCWNGPERSLRVKMRCGTKLELRSVDEPSRCEYAAELSTPALCLDARLQKLEDQLVMEPKDEL